MATDKYKLQPFDAASVKATRLDWERQLQKKQEDLFSADFLRFLDWVDTHMDYADGGDEGLAYGIFRDGSKHAVAIVDVVYSKRGTKWLKMMGVNLSPDLYLRLTGDNDDFVEVLDVYQEAVFGTLALTSVHKSNTVKLYGRSGTLLAFLKALAGHTKPKLASLGINVTVEGRWVVFRKKSASSARVHEVKK